MQNFDIIDYVPAGSQLFTAAGPEPESSVGNKKIDAGLNRVSMGPTRWPTMVVKSTGNKAFEGEGWGHRYRPAVGKIAEEAQEDLERNLGKLRMGKELNGEQTSDL